MPPAFQLRFAGDPEVDELDRIRKLLNMGGYGRLDDHMDSEFGSRLLRKAYDEHGKTIERVVFTLDRRTRGDWVIQLWYLKYPPPAEVVDQLAAEALVAAERIGFTFVEELSDYRPPATDKTVLKLPTRQALVITLGGLGKHFSGPLATLEVGLGLRRESGGGRVPAECGWRFLQRDRSRWILLQMLWNRPEDEVQVVVYDDQPDTDPALLHACRLQVAAAATMAGLTWKTQEPPPRPGELSTADIAARAADVENIDQLWQRFDARDASKELKRAILLAALAPLVSAYSTQMPPVMLGFQRIVPEEAPIPETLREETESFLLDFPNI